MGQTYGDGLKERIREACDIVSIIETYVPLKRAGRTYTGLCPFHSDTHVGNFRVFPENQYFECFACHEKGDVFTFIKNSEMLDFRGALEFLADRVGIKLPKRKEDKQTEILYDINNSACDFFQNQLQSSEEAQGYLARRKINSDSISKFRIGYAQDSWDSLLNGLSKNFTREELKEAGLARPGKTEGFYDYFRGRIIFPFFSPSGKDVLGFGGRILNADADKETPKYLNTPETRLFNKGKLLYGFNFASRQAREKDQLILVEGYTDVIQSHQNKIENVAAIVGTALTENHLEFLSKRQSLEVVLCFDGDEAGINAASKASESVILRPRSRIWVLPEGKDPADLLEHGIDFRENLIINKPPFEFLTDYHSKKLDLATLDGKITLLESMRKTLENIPESKKGICLETLAQQIGITFDSIRQYFYGINEKKETNQSRYKHLTTIGTQIDFLQKLASSFSPEVIEHFKNQGVSAADFNDSSAKALFIYLSNTEEAMSLFYTLMPLGKGAMFEEKVEQIRQVAGEEGIIPNATHLKNLLRGIPNEPSTMNDLETAYLRMKARSFSNKIPDALARGEPVSKLVKIINEANEKLKN